MWQALCPVHLWGASRAFPFKTHVMTTTFRPEREGRAASSRLHDRPPHRWTVQGSPRPRLRTGAVETNMKLYDAPACEPWLQASAAPYRERGTNEPETGELAAAWRPWHTAE